MSLGQVNCKVLTSRLTGQLGDQAEVQKSSYSTSYQHGTLMSLHIVTASQGAGLRTPLGQILSLSLPRTLPTTGAEDKPVLRDQAREGCQWTAG